MSEQYTSPRDQDASAELGEQIRQADAAGSPLRIVGGDTRGFYGRKVEGTPLSLDAHRGITHYDPVELIVSVRTGTPLAELEAALDAEGQMLGCEPPRFGDASTVGGMVATGLSGPRRPWSGAVRDFVLGTRVLDRAGRELRFGGEVMKNVAGYDLSRLMVGAQGTLGVVSEVSMKVLPKPAASASLHLDMPLEKALDRLTEWGRQPLPITAAAYLEGALHLRLEGGASSVAATRERLGGDELKDGFWQALRDLALALLRWRYPTTLAAFIAQPYPAAFTCRRYPLRLGRCPALAEERCRCRGGARRRQQLRWSRHLPGRQRRTGLPPRCGRTLHAAGTGHRQIPPSPQGRTRPERDLQPWPPLRRLLSSVTARTASGKQYDGNA